MESLVVGSLQEAEATAHETLNAQQRLRLDLAVQDPYQSHLEEVVLSLQSQLKNQEMGDDWQQIFHDSDEQDPSHLESSLVTPRYC